MSPRVLNWNEVGEWKPFTDLRRRLLKTDRIHAGGLWGSSQALVTAQLAQDAGLPLVAIVSNEEETEVFQADLDHFGARSIRLPARETYSARSGKGSGAHVDLEAVRGRLRAVLDLSACEADASPPILVASLLSLLQPVPREEELSRSLLTLEKGARLDVSELMKRLVARGYSRSPLAERSGEFSLRGDIFDVFPFAAEVPTRVELFDDEIESVRAFDPETQRSIEEMPAAIVCLAQDAGGVDEGGRPAWELLGPDAVLIEIEPLRIEEQAETLRIQSSAHARSLAVFNEAMKAQKHVGLQSLPGDDISFGVHSVQGLEVGIRDAPAALTQIASPPPVGKGQRVRILCRNEAEEKRFRETLGPTALLSGVETVVGSIARGFQLPEAGLVLINHREIARVAGSRPRVVARPQHRVRALKSFFDLKLGDLVVHAVHGIGRFVGLTQVERAGAEGEHLHLVFADEVILYVPASKIELVQRYVGSGHAAPKLDKIGGAAFRKRKEKVERALIDLAGDLLEVQAKRASNKRPSWEDETGMVEELVGSFPHTDTPDQVVAHGEISKDLRTARPMDRLLCGDVGFGKTELAVRAAFRVACGGGQVAILVPTTVLAKQHFETFRERLADFPVEVEAITRTKKGSSLKEVLDRVATGRIDILIGTHRILSKDVKFKRLGLVIIDEEQRFGVSHKEHFKQLRSVVDVLTMTATPIPRTLHMSLSGVRDISSLSEPPEGRQEVETVIANGDENDLLRAALLRERNRGGQVFFLHNRVQSIERRTRELENLVPECSYVIGHGQMPGRGLERVMSAFSRGDVDVLVATTIIENGIDIPSAGTILIDDADRFGLSELHQLRGRVGRGRHKSYCFLLLDRLRPIREAARRRIKALEELTQLGAGFQISMKDLEIRGAGNILGPEQSGHIAAIGYEMYCQLLEQAVERLASAGAGRDGTLPDPGAAEDGTAEMIARALAHESRTGVVELELGVEGFLPRDWIPEADARLDLLRTLASIDGDTAADEVRAMMRDRFGRIPDPAEALLRQFRLRARLQPIGVTRLAWRGDRYDVQFQDPVAIEHAFDAGWSGAEDRRPRLRPIGSGRGIITIPPEEQDAANALTWIEQALPDPGSANKMAHRP